MNKSGIKLLISLLAIGSIYCQTTGTSTSSGSSCSTTSKFLRMLRNMNQSIVLTAPLTSTSFKICSEVWSTSGTCCDVDALNSAFDKKMIEGQKGGYDKFIGGLKNVGQGLEKIMQTISNKDELRATLDKLYTANSTQFNGMTVDQAVDILAESKTFKADVQTFKTDGKKCFEAIKENAGKIFCYGCAAISETALDNADGSSLITQKSCDNLLTTCISTWNFIFRIGGMMQVISILNKNLKADAPAPRVQDKKGFGGVSPSDMLKSYSACSVSLTDAACTEVLRTNLCKANFNILAAPKQANDNNMQKENVAGLPEPSRQGSNSTANSTGTAPPPAKRVLQTGSVTESSGDIGTGANGADLTKKITTPTTTAVVDSTSTDSGLTKSSAPLLILNGIAAFVIATCLLK